MAILHIYRGPFLLPDTRRLVVRHLGSLTNTILPLLCESRLGLRYLPSTAHERPSYSLSLTLFSPPPLCSCFCLFPFCNGR